MVESGPLGEEEITRKLAGSFRTPQVAAFLSMLEWQIGDVRARAEMPGVDAGLRSELCGGVFQLKELRANVIALSSRNAES